MSHPLRRAWAGLLLFALPACGSPPPPAYLRETEQAQNARRKGQHLAAAEHYERAILLSVKPRDAEEARYRAADSYARAGDAARAETLYRELAAGGGNAERGARADFALADLLRTTGRELEAQRQLVLAIQRHPGSGLARGALSSHLDFLREQGGSARVLAFLTEEVGALASTELGETILYRRGRELDLAGRSTEARDAYLACAARFPYPKGVYWDDALFRAAEQELVLGAPARAIEHLRRMLAEQETATITGSYERGRYAEGQLKIAQIFRDMLNDPGRARLELRKVWTNHPKSRLVDDALFQEALLARAAGDQAGACHALSIILQQRADSRYAGCAHLLCPALTSTTPCHAYIRRVSGLE